MIKETKLNIAVIDDHPSMRDGLRANLQHWPHGQVMMEAGNGIEYETACATGPPIHIATVDLRMPMRDGYETIEWIREHQPHTLTLAITFETPDDVVHRALLAGAHGIVDKCCERNELYTALDHLRTTGRYVNDLVLRQLTHTPDPGSPWALRKKAEETLSKQEMRFFKHYTSDAEPSIDETAGRMCIAPSTAETYRKRIVEKTGARTRTMMVKFGIYFGLIKV